MVKLLDEGWRRRSQGDAVCILASLKLLLAPVSMRHALKTLLRYLDRSGEGGRLLTDILITGFTFLEIRSNGAAAEKRGDHGWCEKLARRNSGQ